jgi:hypothetical protein
MRSMRTLLFLFIPLLLLLLSFPFPPWLKHTRTLSANAQRHGSRQDRVAHRPENSKQYNGIMITSGEISAHVRVGVHDPGILRARGYAMPQRFPWPPPPPLPLHHTPASPVAAPAADNESGPRNTMRYCE